MGTGLRGECSATCEGGTQNRSRSCTILQRPMEENHAQVQLKRHGTVTSK